MRYAALTASYEKIRAIALAFVRKRTVEFGFALPSIDTPSPIAARIAINGWIHGWLLNWLGLKGFGGGES
ncbi:MAG: hypothetical protein OHK0035_38640 [Cyanobacteria bacterium J069]